jgi:Kef-type K+ transport system membrane component KefB
MSPIIFWLLATFAWLLLCYVSFRLLWRLAPKFAADHSPETAAVFAVFFAALLAAVLWQ